MLEGHGYRYHNEIVPSLPAAELEIRPAIAESMRHGRPVVALESTLIAQGLPWPINLETARAAENAVRAAGAVPATIAVIDGRAIVGLTDSELERFACDPNIRKASSRDLGAAVALCETAATTVAASIRIAHAAGISVFATGGIGGVHRPPAEYDVSADLAELARTPVAVVCAGAKSILDIPRTLEMLETLSVPVIGYRCDEFPGFVVRTTGQRVSARIDDVAAAARLLRANWRLGGAGVVIAQPIAAEFAIEPEAFESAFAHAEQAAADDGVRGGALTPFLLARIAELTSNRTVQANRELIVANARLAAETAGVLTTSAE